MALPWRGVWRGRASGGGAPRLRPATRSPAAHDPGLDTPPPAFAVALEKKAVLSGREAYGKSQGDLLTSRGRGLPRSPSGRAPPASGPAPAARRAGGGGFRRGAAARVWGLPGGGLSPSAPLPSRARGPTRDRARRSLRGQGHAGMFSRSIEARLCVCGLDRGPETLASKRASATFLGGRVPRANPGKHGPGVLVRSTSHRGAAGLEVYGATQDRAGR